MKQLLRQFFRKKPVKKTSSLLILIDVRKHTRGGHFGPWLKWFGLEFSSRFDRTVITTPNTSLTRSLFQDVNLNQHGAFTFRKIPRRFKKAYDLNHLAKKFAKSDEKVCFFLMWGHDLLHLKLIDCQFPWATFFNISKMIRQPTVSEAHEETKIKSIIENDRNCKAFFYLDNYLSNVSEKAELISDMENVQVLESKSKLIDQIENFSKGKLTVGVFGILTGSRCLNALLSLARNQPAVNFVLVGKIKQCTVSENFKNDLMPGVRKNLFIYPHFLEMEAELNSAMNAVDGILLDGSHYTNHSGIVCKALYFGKGVISPSGNSWTNDLIKDANVGINYDSPDFELKQKWGEWVQSGGPENCKLESDRIRSQAAVKRSFDNMKRRLLCICNTLIA